MIDSRAGKMFDLSWDEWRDFCGEQGIDPEGCWELNFDLGGGNWYSVTCYGQLHEEYEIPNHGEAYLED